MEKIWSVEIYDQLGDCVIREERVTQEGLEALMEVYPETEWYKINFESVVDCIGE